MHTMDFIGSRLLTKNQPFGSESFDVLTTVLQTVTPAAEAKQAF